VLNRVLHDKALPQTPERNIPLYITFGNFDCSAAASACSWAELYLSPIGEGVLIVYERDGVPLSDSEGPLALVSLKDTRPGPRHVKWLSTVEVRTIAD
jgi:hypothetical protein